MVYIKLLIVTELNGYKETVVLNLIKTLSLMYKLPKVIYVSLEQINTFFVYKIWRGQIYLFQLKQLGIIEFGRKFINKVKRKLKKVVVNAK